MPLSFLSLRNFRNFEDLQWELSPGLNILEGQNAQGKTNLLEAIYLLANGRSFRTHQVEGLIHFQKNRADVVGTWRDQGLSTLLEVFLTPEERLYHWQGKPLRGLAKVHEFFRVLIFTPDSSSLFRVSAQGRRRYFDQAVALHQPDYTTVLGRYQRILRQRNQFLERGGDHEVLEAFDRQWAEASHHLWAARQDYLREILPFWGERFNALSGMALALGAHWRRGIESGPWDQPEALCRVVQDIRPRELKVGKTLWGPHRDDLVVQFSDRSVREFASQGQQRLLVIALKLAEADLFRSRWGRSPVFLLDDLGSELDEARQRRLIRLLGEINAQTILTTTRAGAYRELQGAIFSIRGGKLSTEQDSQTA